MARRTGITNHLLATLQSGTNIDAQVNDQVRVTDLGSAPGRIFYCVAGNAVSDDGEYTIVEGTEANQWRSQEEVNSILATSLNVPFSALLDNTEENVAVAVAGVSAGQGYVIGVVSGLPADVDIELEEDHGAGTLNFRITNNSGATLTASNIVVNVYTV